MKIQWLEASGLEVNIEKKISLKKTNDKVADWLVSTAFDT